MELGDLEVFSVIAEERSISKAAKRLNYVQSNVTARIKRLENELHTELFYRHSRGVSLTSSGKTLLTYAEKISALTDEAKKAVSDHTESGPLAVGSIESTAAVRLPVIINKYMSDFPAVDFSLKTGTTEELLNDILEFKLDGAFVAGPVGHPELQGHLFVEEELVLLSDTEHTKIQSLQDMNDRTLLILKQGCIYRKQLETWLSAEGIFPKRKMEFSTLEGLLGCLKAGLGISLLSRHYVVQMHMKETLQCFTVPAPYQRVSTVFIHRRDVLFTKALQSFMEKIDVL
ncbi:LysR family transcriptional regulator [Alteribacillus sp. HJP-4]|uniref:LysR family transcriptional regulator n=1 Tax=Alteribacillus sp. HJP-4 TaxID=2775394 RepID=UPI0035CD2E9A